MIYKAGAILLLLATVLAAAWFNGHTNGYDSAKREQQDINEKVLKRQDKLISELETAKREAATKQKVKNVYITQDPTGCADSVIPDGLLQSIRSGH
jgi:hypothetical protein